MAAVIDDENIKNAKPLPNKAIQPTCYTRG